MILGEMSHKERYFNIHPKMKCAFDFLDNCFTEGIKPGKYQIDGKSIYAVAFLDNSGQKENLYYETHDKYIDVQCIISGCQTHWYLSREALQKDGGYDSKEDITLYLPQETECSLTLRRGEFAIYFPEDGHLPAVCVAEESPCIRVVIKIELS